ncbi:MAG: AAA family ATPase [Pseudomonadota bacterium]
MKIDLSGLGIVPDLQISLKPLTVFVGENGTGKTWTAYTIAGMFGHYGFDKYVKAYLRGETAFRYTFVEEAINDLVEKGSATVNVAEFSMEHAETYINELAKLAPTWMNRFFATTRVDFGKMSIHAELSIATKQALSSRLKDSGIKVEGFVGVKRESSKLRLTCLKEKGDDQLYFYTKYEKNDSEAIPPPVVEEEIKEFVVVTIFRIIGSALFENVVIFPTERTTFITLPFPHDQEEYREMDQLEKGTRPGRSGMAWRISQPVGNLLGIIESCMRQSSVGREEKARDPKVIQLMRLGKFLEDEILLGNISTERHGNQVELMYNPSEDVSLELNVSSSMVKELAPLALYLKCLAEPGDLLVIDEPEMNLHPAAQVELTEFLGMLVNAGLHVLITTHSPYIVDHIPNLIRANDLDKEKVKDLFYLKQVTSFLAKDDVSVYLFESDSVTDILKEDGDINWETFGNVSRDLSSIYSGLIE